MKLVVCIALCILLICTLVHAAEPFRAPQARLPLMKAAPTIDGTIANDEWTSAARMERFCTNLGLLSPQEASFWIGCDGKDLFIAVRSQTPPGGKIMSRITPLPENADARTWEDDSIELVIDPLHTDTTGRRRIYHANLNARGAISDTAYVPGGGGEAWRGTWRIASNVANDRWHFEVAIPLADIGVTAADLAHPMGVRIVRNWLQRAPGAGPHQTEWSPLGGAYLSPDTIPLVTWDASAPIVQQQQVWNPQKLQFHPSLTIRNPHDKPIDVVGTIKSVPRNSAHTTETKQLTIAAGETATLELSGGSLAREDVRTAIDVTSVDGSAVYYRRDYNIALELVEELWVLDEDAAKKVDVSFAYFPYHDTIRTIVNINGLEEKARVTGITARVRSKSDGKEIATTKLPPMQAFTTEMIWKSPALGEGEYQFVIELEGLKIEPTVKDFVRHIMPWERNSLGKSDVVVAPFEPIAVDGQTVKTVLRSHALGAIGLWNQVQSLDKPILKSPMRLEVRSGDKTVEASAREMKFVEQKPTRVITESNWTAGQLTGTARSEWDYDGMMKWTLQIPSSTAAVDSMTLVIPLDDALMSLFHAVTDGLRFNYAGATPKGDGRVWDGSKAARNSIIGSYVPYIWLGGEERGLAVFGENDRGWVRNPEVPCQELVRTAEGTLELRLNLIAKPTTIDAERTIVIGLQATPTKPMREGWRTSLVNGEHPAASRMAHLHGCCYQWGALTAYDDIYARDEDFTVYEKLAEVRKTGNVDNTWLTKWMADTRLPDGADRGSFESNLGYGFRAAAHKWPNILVYTNPRGFRHDTREGQTFLDEWHVEAFVSRKSPYGGGSSYGGSAVESFRDYALWYYKKMLDTFADDIYWDNVYLKSCFDTVGADAYEISPGVIQPAMGLWNMRELIRRVAVLDHELGRSGTMNMVHSTNTATAPIMAFSHSHLTFEDRQGDSDFQDRFTREYIRAESIGRQHGSTPFALLLMNGTDEKKIAWAKRTAAGVLMTHEIRSALGYDEWRTPFFKLLDFGYGKPEARVYNYWQADNPVSVAGTDATTLAVSKPAGGGAMIVVCDWASGGDVTLNVDAGALGLKTGFAAKDAETGESLTIEGAAVKFPLKRHDFRMIVLE